MSEERVKRKLSAILSADVVGYSRLMGEDEVSTVRTLEAYRKVMSDLIEQFRGRVVDSPGDNLLSEFASVVDAVQCAVEIHEVIRAKNEELPEDRRMLFRIGVNLGDVIEEGDRIYGDGVNIAARLEGLAEPGGICISGSAHEQIENKLALGYEFLGEHTVKNIAKPVKVYKVPMGPKAVTSKEGDEKKAKLKNWQWTARSAVGAIIVIIVALVIWNFYLRAPSIEPDQTPVATDMKEAPKTIAVLPFEDFSPEKNQEYFVNGLSEEILNTITQIPNLYVTGRTSSFSFKGSNKTTQEIAEILGVENILEGSVRKVGNILRITAQLIRAEDDFHLWSKSYDKELKNVLDILDIQEAIATAVANELKLTLKIGNSFGQLGSTSDVKAYEYYLIAREQGVNLNLEKALELIDKAIELDPGFALALAQKSSFHLTEASWSPAEKALLEINKANEAAHKALEVEPSLDSAYVSLASVHMARGEFFEAESAMHKAIELRPESINRPSPILQYTSLGYLKKCNKILGEMILKDPLDPVIRGAYMLNLGYLGDMKGAEEEYEHCKVLLGDQWEIYGNFNITVLRLGAKEAFLNEWIPDVPVFVPEWSRIIEYVHSPDEGLKLIYQLLNSIDWQESAALRNTAFFASYFGDQEIALNAIEKAINIHAGYNLFFIWAPVFHDARQLPRFKEYVREIGLVDYWKKYGWPDLCRPVGGDDFVCD